MWYSFSALLLLSASVGVYADSIDVIQNDPPDHYGTTSMSRASQELQALQRMMNDPTTTPSDLTARINNMAIRTKAGARQQRTRDGVTGEDPNSIPLPENSLFDETALAHTESLIPSGDKPASSLSADELRKQRALMDNWLYFVRMNFSTGPSARGAGFVGGGNVFRNNLQPVADGFNAAYGMKATVIGDDKIDFQDGNGPIDVITVGGDWWFGGDAGSQ